MEKELSFLQENRLLEMFEHSFNFLKLEDLAKIISLSKRFLSALCQNPRFLISMIKKFYLSQNHVHPKLRRYFQVLLTKRPRIDISNLSDIAKEIYLLAQYRIKISKNLIRDVYCVKNKNKILETRGGYFDRQILDFDTRERRPRRQLSNEELQDSLIERKNGGNGWDLTEEIIPEFRKKTLASSFSMCEISYKAFFKQFSSDFLEDFRSGKTVLKAGCFISRRLDCGAYGGCVFQIFDDSNQQLIFSVKQHKRSDEIPVSWKSDFVYHEISFIIPFKDLPLNIDFSKCSMGLIIYGKDERFWAGHYGSRFSAMYIRGDYAENPLTKLLN